MQWSVAQFNISGRISCNLYHPNCWWFRQRKRKFTFKKIRNIQKKSSCSGYQLTAGWLLVQFPRSASDCLAALQQTPPVQRLAHRAKPETQNFPQIGARRLRTIIVRLISSPPIVFTVRGDAASCRRYQPPRRDASVIAAFTAAL